MEPPHPEGYCVFEKNPKHACVASSTFASGAPLNHSPNLYCKGYITGAVKGFVTQLAANATGILTRKNNAERIIKNIFVSIIWSKMVLKKIFLKKKPTPIPANLTIHISYSLSPTAIVFESPIPYWFATCNIALLLQNL